MTDMPMNERTVSVSMKRIDLCNLMLACSNTAYLLEQNGKPATKWNALHDQLKAALDAFDREQSM